MNDYETLFRFEQTKFGVVFTDKDGKTDCVEPLKSEDDKVSQVQSTPLV